MRGTNPEPGRSQGAPFLFWCTWWYLPANRIDRAQPRRSRQHRFFSETIVAKPPVSGSPLRTSLTKSAPSRMFRYSFRFFLSTPICLRNSACLIAVDFYFFPFHVHPTGSTHSLHRLGVAHQTSLRSLLTMMSSSNSRSTQITVDSTTSQRRNALLS